MKLRLGHVTNSSSSSYIVALDKRVKGACNTIEEFCEQWCDSVEEYKNDYPSVPFNELEKEIQDGKFLMHISIDGYGDHAGDIKYLLKLGGIKAKVIYSFD